MPRKQQRNQLITRIAVCRLLLSIPTRCRSVFEMHLLQIIHAVLNLIPFARLIAISV